MKLIILVLVILMTGCGKTDIEHRERGKIRHKLFVECMELVTKIERQGDDDVSDAIESCGSQAYYMSNQLTY